MFGVPPKLPVESLLSGSPSQGCKTLKQRNSTWQVPQALHFRPGCAQHGSSEESFLGRSCRLSLRRVPAVALVAIAVFQPPVSYRLNRICRQILNHNEDGKLECGKTWQQNTCLSLFVYSSTPRGTLLSFSCRSLGPCFLGLQGHLPGLLRAHEACGPQSGMPWTRMGKAFAPKTLKQLHCSTTGLHRFRSSSASSSSREHGAPCGGVLGLDDELTIKP